MKYVIAVICIVLCWAHGSLAQGRALSESAREAMTTGFRPISSQIAYDDQYLLVNLAGRYAFCDQSEFSFQEVIGNAVPSGYSLRSLADSIEGGESHVKAVEGYVDTIVDQWRYDQIFNDEIRAADRFGCGVRPGCDGRMVIACVFRFPNEE